jgi:hypothetical protein
MPRRRKPSGRKPSFKPGRSLSALRRTAGTRLPLKRIVIVCEGEKTEPEYFRGLQKRHKLLTLAIEIVSGKVAPTSVVEEGRRQFRQLDDRRDEVWCVFDTESLLQAESVARAADMARSNGLKLAVSNPAFEYWYILHFERTDSPFHDATDTLDRLKHHLPEYDKSVPVFEALVARIPTAIENAQQLRSNAVEPWDTMPNPSTSVDLLVIEIEALAKQAADCT